MAFFKEFKKFIARGNVMDLAVGVIIGAAFTSIVNSLVNDVIMPVISLITGGIDFSTWKLVLGSGPEPATLNYGALISAAINFILVALVLFCVVRAINKLRAKQAAKEEATEAPKEQVCPYCQSKIDAKATRCPHCTSMLSHDGE